MADDQVSKLLSSLDSEAMSMEYREEDVQRLLQSIDDDHLLNDNSLLIDTDNIDINSLLTSDVHLDDLDLHIEIDPHLALELDKEAELIRVKLERERLLESQKKKQENEEGKRREEGEERVRKLAEEGFRVKEAELLRQIDEERTKREEEEQKRREEEKKRVLIAEELKKKEETFKNYVPPVSPGGTSEDERLRFTEKEIERFRYQIIKQGMEEAALVNKEILLLEQKLREDAQAQENLKNIIEVSEDTILRLLAEANVPAITSKDTIPEMVLSIDDEVKRISMETATIEDAIRKISVKAEESKQVLATQRATEEALRLKHSKAQQDIVSSENVFQQLKLQAETKLGSAATKVASLRSQATQKLEKVTEMLATQEAHTKTLEQAYIEKLKENQNVQGVFEEVAAKFDDIISKKQSPIST